MPTQHRSGFTVIELLVVLAIIAILAGIGVPVYLNMSRTTRYNSCMENMRQIGVALALYRSEYDRFPAAPPVEFLQHPTPGTLPLSETPSWQIEYRLSSNKKTVVLAAVDGLIVGQPVKLIPNLQWTITGKTDASSVQLASGQDLTDLTSGTAVKLLDATTGKTEDAAIASVDTASSTLTFDDALALDYGAGGVLTAVMDPETDFSIASIPDATHVVLQDDRGDGRELQYSYANGGTLELAPVKVEAQTADDTLRLASVAGFTAGMRVTLKDKWGKIGDEPVIDSVDITARTVAFRTPLTHTYTSSATMEQTVGNFGLATLYQLYLTDTKDYLRSYQLYHCPELRRTAKVDRGELLEKSSLPFRDFDPLWGGFNTYDLTYNYDQFDGAIYDFDGAMGYDDDTPDDALNIRRQLSNPTAPANTVVCWCYGHGAARPTPGKGTLEAALNIDSTSDIRRAERQRASQVSLVLWVDGTVRPVRPFLTQAKDGDNNSATENNSPYYWTPPFLYMPEDARK